MDMIGTEILSETFGTNVLIGIATILLFYWFTTRNHDYWKKRGIPYVKPTPFFGTILETHNTYSPDIELKRSLELGLVHGLFEANRPLLNIGDPKILRTILVKDFPSFSSRRYFRANDEVLDSMLVALQGEQWKRIRAIVSPTFTSGKIKRMIGIFKECSRTLLQNLKQASDQKKSVDAKRVYGAFTMDVIASSAFSTKIDSHNNPDNNFVKTAKIVFQKRSGWRHLINLLFPNLTKLLGVSARTPDMHFFKHVTFQIIEERRRTGQTRNDFLQLLLDTAKEVEQDENETVTSEKKNADLASNYIDEEVSHELPKYTYFKKDLSVNELVGQCVIFFLAGYETTASTLSHATYCLALNEDVQEKLRAEVDTVLKENNGELTYEAVQEMKYLDNVISEALRLYPPVARIERISDSDYHLRELGITIPKGMVIAVPIYAIHRNPNIYPDPEKFNPDRFTPEERAKRDSYAYLPFAAGPRNCIAMRFALLELKVCLAHVVAAYKIKRNPQTKVPLNMSASRGLLTPRNIYVGLEPREGYQPIR